MYNRYLTSDAGAFESLYSRVDQHERHSAEREHKREHKIEASPPALFKGLDLSRILKGFRLDGMGVIPLLILLFLIMDVDDDEKLIIIALAVLIGL